jgi:predicted acyltransferase
MGPVLVVTRRRAQRPGLELITGLVLIAAGFVPAAFTLIAGIGNTDAWWMPAHVMFAVGIPLATLLSAAARLREPQGSAATR